MCIRDRPLITNWYFNYLTHRNVKTKYNNEEATGTIATGFPQGGVCSAKFWIIVFDKAIDIINQYGVKGTGFADDCILLLHRSNPQHAVDIIQRVINELVIWGEKAGLKFNPQKTVAIIFTRSNKLELPNKIKMYNTEVDFSYETKYLGVLLDSKLLWTKHFQ